jgi:hypothetical protein
MAMIEFSSPSTNSAFKKKKNRVATRQMAAKNRQSYRFIIFNLIGLVQNYNLILDRKVTTM